jgi:hypothetical protein
MVRNPVDPTPTPDPDHSTAYTAPTPPDTLSADLDDHDPLGGADPGSFSVPWPDSTFIIRSVASGQVMTLLDGQIVLAPLGGRGSIHWECVENKGWLGFRNLVTGKFLGHNGKRGGLCCSAGHYQDWEKFCVRKRPEGGYIMLMTHWGDLWPVGMKVEQEVETLAKIENRASDGVVWEFIKV